MERIRQTDLAHDARYVFRTNEDKLRVMAAEFPELSSFFDAIHQKCPQNLFRRGPHASAIQAGPLPSYQENASSGFTDVIRRLFEQHGFINLKSDESEKAQKLMLESVEAVIASAVPVWSDYVESQPFQPLMSNSDFLSGHIDLLVVEGGLIWIWKIKTAQTSNRWLHVQLLAYAWMLSKRTGIPLEYFRCGYLDHECCKTFIPWEQHYKELEFYSYMKRDEPREITLALKPRLKEMKSFRGNQSPITALTHPRKVNSLCEHPAFFRLGVKYKEDSSKPQKKSKQISVVRVNNRTSTSPKKPLVPNAKPQPLPKPVPLTKPKTLQEQIASGCLMAFFIVSAIFAFVGFFNDWMMSEKTYVPPQIDQEEIDSIVRIEEPKIKPYASSPPSRSTGNRFASYQAINKMAAVTDVGRVRFGNKYPVIGIRKSATEISLNEIISGETLTVEKYEDPFFAFQWSASDKLMTRINAPLTENILVEVNQEFGLAQLGQSQVALLKLFPKVEPLGVIREEFADIKGFAVNEERSKIAYVRADGNVWLGEKDETEAFALRQMCIDPMSEVMNVGLFSDNKVVIGWTSGEFAIYESSSELPIRVIDSLEEGLTAFAVSPDNSLLVAGYASGLVAIYSLTGPEQLRQIRNEIIDPIFEIVFRGDSEAFAVVTENGEVITFGSSTVRLSTETGVSETERINKLLRSLLQQLKTN